MSTPFSYFDMIEVFEKPGCAVCNLLLRDAERFITSLLYEYTLDGQIQGKIRAARGLCNQHSWHLMSYRGNVLNITVLYSAALDEVVKTLEGDGNKYRDASWLKRLRGGESEATTLATHLEAQAACPVCTMLTEAEKTYVETVSQYIGDSRFEAAYRSSDGFCLPHLRQILKRITQAADLERLITTQEEIWRKILADMEILKDRYNVSRGDAPFGEDGDSWRRAIRLLAGEKGVFGKDE
jgi:hypothetical protein